MYCLLHILAASLCNTASVLTVKDSCMRRSQKEARLVHVRKGTLRGFRNCVIRRPFKSCQWDVTECDLRKWNTRVMNWIKGRWNWVVIHFNKEGQEEDTEIQTRRNTRNGSENKVTGGCSVLYGAFCACTIYTVWYVKRNLYLINSSNMFPALFYDYSVHQRWLLYPI